MEAAADDERDGRVFQDFMEVMEAWARSMGLYLTEASAQRAPLESSVSDVTDPVVRPWITARFVLGDEAFSDRVQHPEKYSDEAMLSGMEHATLEAEAERITQRFRETGELFDEC